MIKGNLLLESEAFRLTDAELPMFAERMEAFVLAVDKCRKHGDSIYGKGDLCNVIFLGKPLYEYYDSQSYKEIQQKIPGFSRDMHVYLTCDFLGYDNKTLSDCTTLADLDSCFPTANNGLFGPECDRFDCSDELAVCSEETWHQWKIAYLTKQPHHIDWSKATHQYLPNLDYSNLLLGIECRNRFGGKDHTDFHAKANPKAGGDMIALSLEVGKIVAEANFYQYNDRVSKLNNSPDHIRDIYSISVKGKIVHMSVDIHNAAFEVCDHNGRHQGQHQFDGKPPQRIDPTGGHGIKVN